MKKEKKVSINVEEITRAIVGSISGIVINSLFVYFFKKFFPFLSGDALIPISIVFALITIFIISLFIIRRKNIKKFVVFGIFIFITLFVYIFFDQDPVSYYVIDFSENMQGYISNKFLNSLKMAIEEDYPQSRIGLAVFGGDYGFCEECENFHELISPTEREQNIEEINSVVDNLINIEPCGKNLLQYSIEKIIEDSDVCIGYQNISVITAGLDNLCESLNRDKINKKDKKLLAKFFILMNPVGNLTEEEDQILSMFADKYNPITEEELLNIEDYILTGWCGDGRCNESETSLLCPKDCGRIWCGDALCNGLESWKTCSGDCGSSSFAYSTENLEIKGSCEKQNGEYETPCLFTPNENNLNSFTSIAKEIYGNDHYAGRIAELYRNNDGLIMPISSTKEMIIPKLEIERELSYYSYYFEVIQGNGISFCSNDFSQFPCFFEIVENNMTYEDLAEYYGDFITDDLIQRIKLANDVEYFYNYEKEWPDLQPITDLEVGMIILLPTTP